MGIFKNDKEKLIEQRQEALEAKLDSMYVGRTADSFRTEIASAINNPEIVVIKPIELCMSIFEEIVENAKIAPEKFLTFYKYAESIYPDFFPYEEQTEDFEKTATVFVRLFGKSGIALNRLYDSLFMSTFKDKNNYLRLCEYIVKSKRAKVVFDAIKDYAVQIREYMSDEDAYFANLLKVASRLNLCETQKIESLLAEEIAMVQHAKGIYNIDPVKISMVEQNVDKAVQIFETGNDLLKTLAEQEQVISDMVNNLHKRAEEIKINCENSLELKVSGAKSKIDKTVEEYADAQKKVVLMEKDLLVKQLIADAEDALYEYRNLAREVAEETANEIGRLSESANKIINSEKMIKVISTADAIAPMIQKEVTAKGKSGHEVAEVRLAKANGRNAEKIEIAPVVPTLDTAIPFEERYAMVKRNKEEKVKAGEHFHMMFDTVLRLVMENANPYLIGPSGCGKTYMIKQISEVLGIDFIDIGYINEEYDILGYNTASGDYNESNFYRCYKYGKIAFCDELDNGNSRASVKLNSFLSNTNDAGYNFPNGEFVRRHDNFRIIGAGNTAGNGADANYNTREKIEESVQQRFTPIYIGYDNAVEKEILIDYVDWYEFMVLFRIATNKWEEINGTSAAGIFTTRDAVMTRKYLDDKSMSMDEILIFQFIQTKDSEYLAFIDETMKKNLEDYPNAKEIYKSFTMKVDAIRKSGRR